MGRIGLWITWSLPTYVNMVTSTVIKFTVRMSGNESGGGGGGLRLSVQRREQS